MSKRKFLPGLCIVMCSTLGLPADGPPFWPCEPGDGAPYGRLTERDLGSLVALASANGLQFLPTLQEVHAGDKEALGRILRFSSRLESLDMPARAYGNMLYSNFLNLSEARGHGFFISVVVAQEPAVRQRIGDFLFYPVFCVPEGERAQAERKIRADFPLLWPPDFSFGKDDSLFGKTP